jgi:hypothetical protein
MRDLVAYIPHRHAALFTLAPLTQENIPPVGLTTVGSLLSLPVHTGVP